MLFEVTFSRVIEVEADASILAEAQAQQDFYIKLIEALKNKDNFFDISTKQV